MIRRFYILVLIVTFAGTSLWALAEPTAEELDQQRRRLDGWRKQPDQLARLRENLKIFSDLPEKRRIGIVKLDRDLHDLPVKKQARLWNALERYADWLEQLRKNDPPAYQAIKAAPDSATRLLLIKDRRDRDWIFTQPKAIRDRWEKLNREQRSKLVVELRRQEAEKHQQWLIAQRFWSELDRKQTMPCRLSDYPEKVRNYVTDFLIPYFSEAEKAQLAKADGRWPDYPQALVEIASKRPSALPPERKEDLPRKFSQLPVPVQNRLVDKKAGGGIQKRLLKEFQQFEGPSFASKVVAIGLRENKLPLGHEFWASNDVSLLPPMRDFVDNKLLPALTDQADKRKLTDALGKWPDYPLTIQDLARKHQLHPPWHYLPEPERLKWDLYRTSFSARLVPRER